MTPREIVESVLIRYSNPERDETCGRMSDIVNDLTRIMEGYVRQYEGLKQHHEGWLRMCRSEAESRKPFLQKLFDRAV